jgi:hypothetical protein
LSGSGDANGPDFALQLHPNIIAAQRGNGVYLGSVFVPKRVMTEQIAQRMNAEFFL